ncbi:unnamed protein product [Musa banksii]
MPHKSRGGMKTKQKPRKVVSFTPSISPGRCHPSRLYMSTRRDVSILLCKPPPRDSSSSHVTRRPRRPPPTRSSAEASCSGNGNRSSNDNDIVAFSSSNKVFTDFLTRGGSYAIASL